MSKGVESGNAIYIIRASTRGIWKLVLQIWYVDQTRVKYMICQVLVRWLKDVMYLFTINISIAKVGLVITIRLELKLAFLHTGKKELSRIVVYYTIISDWVNIALTYTKYMDYPFSAGRYLYIADNFLYLSIPMFGQGEDSLKCMLSRYNVKLTWIGRFHMFSG